MAFDRNCGARATLARIRAPLLGSAASMFTFLFATGIENSAPTIRGGRERVDEFEKCRFYDQWRTDFELLQDLGLRFLRYGTPIHKTWLGDGHYDWAFADQTFADLKAKDIVP